MTVKYTLWRIKEGKRQVWEDWCREIMGKHQEEGVLSLTEEDLVRERCMVFGEGNDSYVLYDHQSLEGKKKKPFNSNRELNLKHNRIFHECLVRVNGETTLGYDLRVE